MIVTMTRGILAGLAAGLVWTIANLLYDGVFRSTVLRHQDQLNSKLMQRPLLLLSLVTGWLVFLGGVFGAIFGVIYAGLPGTPVTKGLFYGGVLLFLPFARAPLEGSVLTSSPREMHWFFLGEAAFGLLAYGLTLGLLTS